MNVLAGKYVLEVNAERNVIPALVHQDNYVRTGLVLLVVVQIWIVPAIGLVSMVNVWILASEIMHVERMLCVKCQNTEQFVSVQMDSKVNQSKDVHLTNVKPMKIVNTINNAIMDHVKILAYNPVLVVLMLSVGL